MFYGGSAGGGKTDLLLGAALTQHQRSIIFRRTYKQLTAIIGRSREIIGRRGAYNGTDKLWKLGDERMIEFGAMEHLEDRENFQGRPHDLKGFDEITQFMESQYRYVIAWNRSTTPGQRSRVVATGNPPTDADGQWIIQYWGPWLDKDHPHKAVPGELRWYATVDAKDIEVESGEPFVHNGETIFPKSRTFIPARMEDNPFLRETGYRAVLQGLDEPLRSQLLYGDFDPTLLVDSRQLLLPTLIAAARQKTGMWQQNGPKIVAGIDVAGSGDDDTVMFLRQGNTIIGHHTFAESDPYLAVQAALTQWLPAGIDILNVDAIGMGYHFAAALERWIKDFGVRVRYVNVGMPPEDDDQHDRFFNQRAQFYWHLRTLMSYGVVVGGEHIDSVTERQLASVKYVEQNGKVRIESKDDARKRGVKSPDHADALMLCFAPDDPRQSYADAMARHHETAGNDPYERLGTTQGGYGTGRSW